MVGIRIIMCGFRVPLAEGTILLNARTERAGGREIA
jgi:hypothetical protein